MTEISPEVAAEQPAEPKAPPKAEPGAANAAPAQTESDKGDTVQQKAEVGVGKRGRGYGQGVLMTPLSIYFSTQERLAFNVIIPHAMQLFKATENRAPKSQQEFMEKIIKDNDIRLPDLPSGHRYVYDPKTEELMVEQPAR